MTPTAKRNLYIGLALVAGIIITLILVMAVTDGDATENNAPTTTTPESPVATPPTTPTNNDETEELQAYMLEDHTWAAKTAELGRFISDHNLQPVSCGNLPGPVQLGDSDINVNVTPNWEALQNARQDASGDLRAFYDAWLGLYDGVDAVAMFEEVNAGILTSKDPSEDHDQITSRVYREYGLDSDAIDNQIAEATVRYKIVPSDDQICSYDIDYNLPE